MVARWATPLTVVYRECSVIIQCRIPMERCRMRVLTASAYAGAADYISVVCTVSGYK